MHTRVLIRRELYAVRWVRILCHRVAMDKPPDEAEAALAQTAEEFKDELDEVRVLLCIQGLGSCLCGLLCKP
jgi:hypothetical protein